MFHLFLKQQLLVRKCTQDNLVQFDIKIAERFFRYYFLSKGDLETSEASEQFRTLPLNELNVHKGILTRFLLRCVRGTGSHYTKGLSLCVILDDGPWSSKMTALGHKLCPISKTLQSYGLCAADAILVPTLARAVSPKLMLVLRRKAN